VKFIQSRYSKLSKWFNLKTNTSDLIISTVASAHLTLSACDI